MRKSEVKASTNEMLICSLICSGRKSTASNRDCDLAKSIIKELESRGVVSNGADKLYEVWRG